MQPNFYLEFTDINIHIHEDFKTELIKNKNELKLNICLFEFIKIYVSDSDVSSL